MSLWRQITRGLRVLTNRPAADSDVADEVQHFFDQATDALRAEGLSPEAARRAARLAVGNPAAVRAVGRANGLNRIAILIPCHRIVNKNGDLGGYGGGLRRKQYLLNLEQAAVGEAD